MPERDERKQQILRQAQEHGFTMLPTEPYVGLTRAEAEQRARDERRQLVDRTGFWTTRRANLSFSRVNVRFDDDGLVAEADAG